MNQREFLAAILAEIERHEQDVKDTGCPPETIAGYGVMVNLRDLRRLYEIATFKHAQETQHELAERALRICCDFAAIESPVTEHRWELCEKAKEIAAELAALEAK